MATIHNLTPVYPATRSTNPHELTAAEDRARPLDEAMWCWTRALRDGVLEVPGRAAIEIADLAGSFDLVGFSYYFARPCTPTTSGPIRPTPGSVPWATRPWPEGLGLVLRRLAEELPGRPLLIDECGFGTDDDEWRTTLLLAVAGAGRAGPSTTAWTSAACSTGPGWTTTSGSFGSTVPFGLFDRDRNARPSAELARAWADRARPGAARSGVRRTS